MMTSCVFTSFLAVVVRGVKLGIIIWYLDTGDHKVVLLIWCMSPQNQPVNSVVLPLWPAQLHNNHFNLCSASKIALYVYVISVRHRNKYS